MADNENSSMQKSRWKRGVSGGGPDAIYGLGIIGAAVYFIQHATSFWQGAFGLLKALVWPAILVY
ncbi:MAG: hypothetical protein M1142_02120, partial [Patescibacteria group bacterium]|nr:hypothetical protein [Patescibacteria group bacterium]